MNKNSIAPDDFRSGYFNMPIYFQTWEHGFIAPPFFSGGNEEKIITAKTLKAFSEALKREKILFGTNQPIKIFEPGIGDGSSTKRFLSAIQGVHEAGYVVYGIDPSNTALDTAKNNLTQAFENVRVQLSQGDAYQAMQDDMLSGIGADVVFGSHFMYFVKHTHNGKPDADSLIDRDIAQFVQNMAAVTNENGIMLLYHDGQHSEIYGPEGIGGIHGDSMTDAPERLARIAQKNGLSVVECGIPARLYFPVLSDKEIEMICDIDRWKDIPENSAQAEWAMKFLFALDLFPISQGGDKDRNSGGARFLADHNKLQKTVETVRDFLQKTDGNYLTMQAQMQVLVKNQDMVPQIETALQHVQEKMPQMILETRAVLKKEAEQYQWGFFKATPT